MDHIATLVGSLVYIGLLIVLLLTSLMVVAVFGFGLFAVYVVDKLSCVVEPTILDENGLPVLGTNITIQISFEGDVYDAAVGYLVDTNNEFLGIHQVIVPGGQNILAMLTSDQLIRIADVAERDWERTRGKP